MEQVSKHALEERKRAFQRIVEKRREIHRNELKRSEYARQEDSETRLKWRSNVKTKRIKEVGDLVDKFLLEEIIRHESNILINVVNSNNAVKDHISVLDKQWKKSLAGLASVENIPDDDLDTFPTEFPHDGDASELTDSDQGDDSEMEYSSIQMPAAKAFLRRTAYENAPENNRFNKEFIPKTPDFEWHDIYKSDAISPFKLSPEELGEKRLAQQENVSPSNMEVNHVAKVGDRPVSKSVMKIKQKRRRSRLFGKPHNSGLGLDLGLLPLINSNVAGATTTAAVVNIASTINSMQCLLLPGHYDPTTEIGAALLTNPILDKYFGRLADSVFIAGPSHDDIEHLLATAKAAADGSKSYDSTILSEKLEPRLLMITNADKDVESEVLPFFCFPGGVEAAVSRLPKFYNTAGSALMSSSDTKASTSNTSNSVADTKNSVDNKPHSAKKFAFILTNHTHTQSGICLTVRYTFKIPETLLQIQTEYCICILSRFPFMNYFFNLMEQFVAIGGLDISEPLIAHEEGFPMNPELRPLSDLAQRLSRLLIPMLNGLSSDDPKFRQERGGAEISAYGSKGEAMLDLHSSIEFSLLGRQPSSHRVRVSLPLDRGRYQQIFSTSLLNVNAGGNNYIYRKLAVPIAEQEQEREREACFHTLLWCLPILLRHMPLEQIVSALGCALTEMHIVVTCGDITVMTASLLALLNLLSPLKWATPIIVTLPSSNSFSNYLESPVPLMLGMQQLPEGFKPPQGLVVIKPLDRTTGAKDSKGSVDLNPTDVVVSHTLQLPRFQKLIQLLKPQAEAIVKLSRRQKLESNLNKSNDNAAEAGSTADKSSHESTSIDIDLTSDTGRQLAEKVALFSAIVSSHIQTVVNTAIKLQTDAKLLVKRERQLSARRSSETFGKRIPSPIGRLGNKSSKTGESFSRRQSTSEKSAQYPVVYLHDDDDNQSLDASVLTSSDLFEKMSVADESTTSQTLATENSLPSIEINDPVILQREIGEAGLKYIKRLQETQMYCNFCYLQASKKKSRKSSGGRYDGATTMGSSSGAMGFGSLLSQAKIDALANNTKGIAEISSNDFKLTSQFPSFTGADYPDGKNNGQPEEESNLLVQLFQMILTGTVPMKQAVLDSLKERYDRDDRNGNTALKYEIPKEQEPLAATGVKEEDIIWCNGRCCGQANTPLCTSICILLWQEKVQSLKHQLNVKDIIHRQHHSDLVMNTQIRVQVGLEDEVKEKVLHIRPRLRVNKHDKETDSQYEMRAREAVSKACLIQVPTGHLLNSQHHQTSNQSHPTSLSSDIDNDDVRSHDNDAVIIDVRSPAVHGEIHNQGVDYEISRQFSHRPRSSVRHKQGGPSRLGNIYAPCLTRRDDSSCSSGGRNNQIIHRCYASKSASLAVKAIALHYANNQRKNLNRMVLWANNKIKSFLIISLYMRRFRRMKIAAVTIQAYVRRLLLELHFRDIYNNIREYKGRKILARIRIRRFLMQNSSRIYYMRKLRLKQQQVSNQQLLGSSYVQNNNNSFSDHDRRQSQAPLNHPYEGRGIAKSMETHVRNTRQSSDGHSALFKTQSEYSITPNINSTITGLSNGSRNYAAALPIVSGSTVILPAKPLSLDQHYSAGVPSSPGEKGVGNRQQGTKKHFGDKAFGILQRFMQKATSSSTLPQTLVLNDPIGQIPPQLKSNRNLSGSPPMTIASQNRLPIIKENIDPPRLNSVDESSSLNSSVAQPTASLNPDLATSTNQSNSRASLVSTINSSNLLPFSQSQVPPQLPGTLSSATSNYYYINENDGSIVYTDDIDELIETREVGDIKMPSDGSHFRSNQLINAENAKMFSTVYGKDAADQAQLGSYDSLDIQMTREITNSISKVFAMGNSDDGKDRESSLLKDHVDAKNAETNPSSSFNAASNISKYPREEVPSSNNDTDKQNDEFSAEDGFEANNSVIVDNNSWLGLDRNEIPAGATTKRQAANDRERNKALEQRQTRQLSTTDSMWEYSYDDEHDDAGQLLAGPFKTFGAAALEAFTTHQRQLIVDVRDLLFEGVPIFKYNRSGKREKRFLFCDGDFSKLYWREKNQPEIDLAGPDHHSLPADKKVSKKKRRSSIFEWGAGKSNTDREILLKDILQIRVDYSSEVMMKAYGKHELVDPDVDEMSSMSLLTSSDHKSLDFTVANEHWGKIYNSLQVVVEYYQIILPGLENASS